jgi:hypothetical protein
MYDHHICVALSCLVLHCRVSTCLVSTCDKDKDDNWGQQPAAVPAAYLRSTNIKHTKLDGQRRFLILVFVFFATLPRHEKGWPKGYICLSLVSVLCVSLVLPCAVLSSSSLRLCLFVSFLLGAGLFFILALSHLCPCLVVVVVVHAGLKQISLVVVLSGLVLCQRTSASVSFGLDLYETQNEGINEDKKRGNGYIIRTGQRKTRKKAKDKNNNQRQTTKRQKNDKKRQRDLRSPKTLESPHRVGPLHRLVSIEDDPY